jgi:hypothetical protein
MNLVGKQLAAQIPDATTGNQARTMFGAMATALSNAYATLDSYQHDSRVQATIGTALFTPVALVYGATPDAIGPAREYLDSTNDMIQGYYGNTFEDDAQLTPDLLEQLRTSVSGTSVAVQTIDDLFGTSWASELGDSVVSACGTVSAAIANTVAKMAGSFIGGMWWIAIPAAVALFYWKVAPHLKGKAA